MDQGISQNRLKQSINRHQKAIFVLIVLSTVLFGVLNIVKQMRTRAQDEAALAAYHESEQLPSEASSESAEEFQVDADDKAPEESEDVRAARDLQWANLQVDYYDSRVNELIKANQEVANYFSDSLLSDGDLRNMPSVQIMTQVLTPTDFPASDETSYTYRAIDRLYQTETFYVGARHLVGRNDISEVYVDELIDVGYDPVAGVLNVKAFHPDAKIAHKLARLATQETLNGLEELGFEGGFPSLLEVERRESMTNLLATRQQLLRDMKTTQDELVLLQGQEPPKVQQADADQAKEPSVRAFSVRSFILYLVAGLLLGATLSILLVVVDLLVTRDRLLIEDYAILGVSPVVAWSKKNRHGVLTLGSGSDLALLLSQYFEGETVALLLPEGETIEDPAFETFAQANYPIDGRFALPVLAPATQHVAVIAPKRGMKQQTMKTVQAALELLHHNIDLMIVR